MYHVQTKVVQEADFFYFLEVVCERIVEVLIDIQEGDTT